MLHGDGKRTIDLFRAGKPDAASAQKYRRPSAAVLQRRIASTPRPDGHS